MLLAGRGSERGFYVRECSRISRPIPSKALRSGRYSGEDLDAWAEKSKGMMPEFLIADMRIMYQFFQDNGMIASKDDLEKTKKLLDKKPRTFDDFVTLPVVSARMPSVHSNAPTKYTPAFSQTAAAHGQ